MQKFELPKERSSLLTYATSYFRPDVFSHPIWVRFGKKDISVSMKIVDDLLKIVKSLQKNDPSAACQILLICAVYQNYAGQRLNALKTTQQSLDLAERTGLTKEIIWAIWGACAICIQQGDYQHAANAFEALHAALSKENEWVLANFIDVFKDYMFLAQVNTEKKSKSDKDQPIKDLVTMTMDWLKCWGIAAYKPEVGDQKISKLKFGVGKKLFRRLRSNYSFSGLRTRWKSLKFVLQGEFKLQLNQTGEELEIENMEMDIPFPYSSFQSFQQKNTATDILVPEITAPSENQKIITKEPLEAKLQTTSMAVQMLGHFNIIIQGKTLKMQSSRSLSLLKYLLLHHKQSLQREMLMDVFWPEAAPETARNNLNVAIYSIRRSLHKITDIPLIVYENGTYGFAYNLQVWLDVEEFERSVQAGKRLESRNQVTSALAEYETAISLYKGDFLEENLYEEWTVIDRERLRITYLELLDRLSQIYFSQERYTACLTLCHLILSRDLCREDAHYRSMQCYSRLHQAPLALRQYQICVEALLNELGVDPAPEVTQLYELIRRHEHV